MIYPCQIEGHYKKALYSVRGGKPDDLCVHCVDQKALEMNCGTQEAVDSLPSTDND